MELLANPSSHSLLTYAGIFCCEYIFKKFWQIQFRPSGGEICEICEVQKMEKFSSVLNLKILDLSLTDRELLRKERDNATQLSLTSISLSQSRVWYDLKRRELSTDRLTCTRSGREHNTKHIARQDNIVH